MTNRFHSAWLLGSIVGVAAALMGACGDSSGGSSLEGSGGSAGSGGNDQGENAGAPGSGGNDAHAGGNKGSGGAGGGTHLGEGGEGGEGGANGGSVDDDPSDVRGRVIDVGGAPVAGAKIQVASTVVTTGKDGRFTVRKVSPAYELKAVLPDGSHVDVYREVTRRDPVVRFAQLGSKHVVTMHGTISGGAAFPHTSGVETRLGVVCDDGSKASVTLSKAEYNLALLTSGPAAMNCFLIALENTGTDYTALGAYKFELARGAGALEMELLTLSPVTVMNMSQVVIDDLDGSEQVESHFGPFGQLSKTTEIMKDSLNRDYLVWRTKWPDVAWPHPLWEMMVQTDVETSTYKSLARWVALQQSVGFALHYLPTQNAPAAGATVTPVTTFKVFNAPQKGLLTMDFAFAGLALSVHAKTGQGGVMNVLLPELALLGLELPRGAGSWSIRTALSEHAEFETIDGALVELQPAEQYLDAVLAKRPFDMQ